jgi:hypothetical protein
VRERNIRPKQIPHDVARRQANSRAPSKQSVGKDYYQELLAQFRDTPVAVVSGYARSNSSAILLLTVDGHKLLFTGERGNTCANGRRRLCGHDELAPNGRISRSILMARVRPDGIRLPDRHRRKGWVFWTGIGRDHCGSYQVQARSRLLNYLVGLMQLMGKYRII